MSRAKKRLVVSLLMTVVVLALTMLGASQDTVLTVGVMAGSYWDAPNGN